MNVYALQSAVFTAIRMDMSVATLEALALRGRHTPVSGDALALAQAAR